MESYVTPVGLILVLAPPVAGAGLAASALALFRPKPITGWRAVAPGAGYWAALLLCLALSAFIGWIWAFIGSSRGDAATQMRIAWWLAFLFGCGAAFAGLRILRLYRQSLRWRGQVMAWNGSGGPVAMGSLASLKTNRLGFAQARFNDGQSLSIALAAAGAAELVDQIADVNGLAPEDRPGEH